MKKKKETKNKYVVVKFNYKYTNQSIMHVISMVTVSFVHTYCCTNSWSSYFI